MSEIILPNRDISSMDFKAGTLLLVDKPITWTSFDVVNKIRYRLKKRLGVKKIKVGHAGTLDPLATGLLVICTGLYTKKLQALQGKDKTYTGVITVGATRPSYDLETDIDQTFPIDHIDASLIEQTKQQFLGPIDQIPPVFSAIKVDGLRVYKKARKGEAVKMEPRKVMIHDFSITKIELPDIHFSVTCSKGTYIRSLAYDFGKALRSGGHLSSLRRTAIGQYKIEDAWELDELITGLEGEQD